MSNLTRLEAMSASLDTAINKANNLPDAGSSGGSSLETCTVTINFYSGAAGDYVSGIAYTSIKSGRLKTEYADNQSDNYEITGVTGVVKARYVIECVVGTDIFLFDDNMLGWSSVTTSENATINENCVSVLLPPVVTINSGTNATINIGT